MWFEVGAKVVLAVKTTLWVGLLQPIKTPSRPPLLAAWPMWGWMPFASHFRCQVPAHPRASYWLCDLTTDETGSSQGLKWTKWVVSVLARLSKCRDMHACVHASCLSVCLPGLVWFGLNWLTIPALSLPEAVQPYGHHILLPKILAFFFAFTLCFNISPAAAMISSHLALPASGCFLTLPQALVGPQFLQSVVFRGIFQRLCTFIMSESVVSFVSSYKGAPVLFLEKGLFLRGIYIPVWCERRLLCFV